MSSNRIVLFALVLMTAIVATPAASATPPVECDVFTPDDVGIGQQLNEASCAATWPVFALCERDLTVWC